VEGEARSAFRAFDDWAAQKVQRAETATRDIVAAISFLRRLDLGLRTPDAVNIAIAQRLGAELLTFDQRMAGSARKLGLTVLPG